MIIVPIFTGHLVVLRVKLCSRSTNEEISLEQLNLLDVYVSSRTLFDGNYMSSWNQKMIYQVWVRNYSSFSLDSLLNALLEKKPISFLRYYPFFIVSFFKVLAWFWFPLRTQLILNSFFKRKMNNHLHDFFKCVYLKI